MANHQSPPLILASQSPRRKQLLDQAGYEFSVHPADESVERAAAGADLSAQDFVARMSLEKANWVANHYQHGIIIAADTIAVSDGEILGKPIDRADAERMLRIMKSTTHRVLTGVTLWHRPTDRNLTRVESTTLRMDDLTDVQISRYLDSGDWRGKAGAFGYQDELPWIHILEGLASNVVGFPVEKLEEWITLLQSNA